ncbi:MAG TPA: hypothetical protein VMR25_11710 [Planctomycetaceae bacterium]|jgi:hypothetical protein|nr:hypothetical protein [Planctomycetaceae bacterium]
MADSFAAIAADLHAMYVSLHDVRLSILALNPTGMRLCRGYGFTDVGVATIPMSEGREPVYFAHDAGSVRQVELLNLLGRAGATLPNRVRKQIASTYPTNAVAWWMMAVWKHSEVGPVDYVVFQPLPEGSYAIEMDGVRQPGTGTHVGWSWDDPIAASLSAIEALGLLETKEHEGVRVDGEWSVPMSKTEFARRILLKRDARARDVKAIFDDYVKNSVGPNTWTFRLDTLAPETRKKLEGGKP